MALSALIPTHYADDSAVSLRQPTDAELETLVTGSAFTPGYPGAHVETNREMTPYRMRGLGTNPGEYLQMRRRDPVINSGLHKLTLAVSGLPWRFQRPTKLDNWTDEDDRRADFAELCCTSQPLGWARFVALTVGGMYGSGYALWEQVFGIDDETGWFKLERHKWIESWQVQSWIVDVHGDWYGAMIIGANGIVPLWREKAFHEARDFNGGNLEGESALRALKYFSDYKRQALLRDAIGQERFGVGTPVFTVSANAGAEDMDKAETAAINFVSGTKSYLVIPDTVKLELLHGGSVMPDIEKPVRLVDQQVSRQLDDNLPGLGSSQYGARAVGEEMRKASDQAVEGLVLGLAASFDQQIMHRIYTRNGWPVARSPRVSVGGFEDLMKYRVLAEFLRVAGVPMTDDQLNAVVERIFQEFGVDA